MYLASGCLQRIILPSEALISDSEQKREQHNDIGEAVLALSEVSSSGTTLRCETGSDRPQTAFELLQLGTLLSRSDSHCSSLPLQILMPIAFTVPVRELHELLAVKRSSYSPRSYPQHNVAGDAMWPYIKVAREAGMLTSKISGGQVFMNLMLGTHCTLQGPAHGPRKPKSTRRSRNTPLA